MRGIDLRKRLTAVVLFAFLAGILYVNLFAREISDSNELFDEYFLKQYQNMEINMGRYLIYLLRIRVVPVVVVTSLMFTRFRKVAAWGTVCWTGFQGGFLMALAVMCMGIKGSFLCVIGGFPHLLLYFAAYIVILWYGMTYPQSRWESQKTVFVTGIMLAGIFLEAYVSPVIMKLFIGIL